MLPLNRMCHVPARARRRCGAAEEALLPALLRPDHCLHFLRPGRLVAVREGPLDWGWGIVLAVHRVAAGSSVKARPEHLPRSSTAF